MVSFEFEGEGGGRAHHPDGLRMELDLERETLTNSPMAVSPPRKGPLDWYFKTNLLLRIFTGLALGGVVGLGAAFGLYSVESVTWVKPFGDVLVRLLQMIVMPIIFASLVVGAASISPGSLGRVGIKALAFFTLTSALAVCLGLIVANIFKPGQGLDLPDPAGVAGREVTAPALGDTLMGIIPRNPFESMATGQVLPTILFAILFGLGICFLREHKEERLRGTGELLLRLFDGVAEVMYMIVRWVLQYAPIGVFALIAVVMAEQGGRAFKDLAIVTFAGYLGFVVQVVLIYGGLLMLNGLSVGRYLRGAKEAIVTAFVTRSSSAALPVTLRCTTDMGVDKSIGSFVLPLGTTVNMDGTAIYQGICALFIGFAIGMPLDFNQQVLVVITAVLASIGTAGVPSAGAIMLLLVLNQVGLTVEAGTAVAAAYAMILGIDAVLDMGRTAVNVSGNVCASLLIAKSEGQLDMEKFNHPERATLERPL